MVSMVPSVSYSLDQHSYTKGAKKLVGISVFISTIIITMHHPRYDSIHSTYMTNTQLVTKVAFQVKDGLKK